MCFSCPSHLTLLRSPRWQPMLSREIPSQVVDPRLAQGGKTKQKTQVSTSQNGVFLASLRYNTVGFILMHTVGADHYQHQFQGDLSYLRVLRCCSFMCTTPTARVEKSPSYLATLQYRTSVLTISPKQKLTRQFFLQTRTSKNRLNYMNMFV